MKLKDIKCNLYPEIDIYYQIQENETSENEKKSRHSRRRNSLFIKEQKPSFIKVSEKD